MIATIIKHCDKAGKFLRIPGDIAPPIPAMPTFVDLVKKVCKEKFAGTTLAPRSTKVIGWRMCKCGCGNKFPRDEMVYMGKPGSKLREYLFGKACAKRWHEVGKKK